VRRYLIQFGNDIGLNFPRLKKIKEQIQIIIADFSSAEAISIKESAREIASSCLLAMTM
jgi:hypothetical protein